MWFGTKCSTLWSILKMAVLLFAKTAFASSGQMDCGQFFCPMEMSDYSDLPADVSPETEQLNVTTARPEDVQSYCCFTIPENDNSISMPYCCAWEDYSDNLYEHTGLRPTGRLIAAFLPVGLALFVTILAAAYIVYFICCRMEPKPPGRAGSRRGVEDV